MAASMREHTKLKTFDNPATVTIYTDILNHSISITHGLRHVDIYDVCILGYTVVLFLNLL